MSKESRVRHLATQADTDVFTLEDRLPDVVWNRGAFSDQLRRVYAIHQNVARLKPVGVQFLIVEFHAVNTSQLELSVLEIEHL